MILQVICSFFAVLFSSIFFKAPKKLILHISIVGAIGWWVYLLTLPPIGSQAATFISSLVIAFLSHMAARLYKSPVTVFFLPAYFPLVPGAGMYRTVYWYAMKNAAQGQHFLGDSLMTAGMIALAVFTIDSIFKVYSVGVKRYREK